VKYSNEGLKSATLNRIGMKLTRTSHNRQSISRMKEYPSFPG